MQTACAIKDACADVSFIFRAGVWKPRTSPSTFQGAGEEGLAWLQEVKRTLGIPVATEVATPEHVEAALKAGIDYLWIGARTSANPLAVQAIVERISGLVVSGLVVSGLMIKNPVNADAQLWLGNIERLEKTGLPVMAVHRGCNHRPCWKMAHEVRLARPDIPMLLDPSHMSGDAAKVPELLTKVEDLGLNGAMIEVHCNPAAALSDAKQQVTPLDVSRWLLAKSQEPRANSELSWLRAEIDELDEQLWDTIAARMDVSRRIGEWKKAHHVAPLQPERYQTIVERINELTNERGLSTDFALRIWEIIHEESLRQQS
jgi:chorismate mutase